jgi:hypothetical protein
MAKDKINRLLDVIYEIEGLAELAFKRDPAPSGIVNLLKEKSATLQEIVNTLNPNEKEEIQSTLAAQLDKEEDEATTIDSDDEATSIDSDDEDVIYSYDDEDADSDIQVEILTEEDEETSVVVPPVNPKVNVDVTVDDVEVEELEAPEEPTSGKRYEIRKLFSINDKFRFRRELFSNNISDFNVSLDLVTVMRRYDEAEDYFYNDLQWDRDNEDVIEFMNKIQEYFNR